MPMAYSWMLSRTISIEVQRSQVKMQRFFPMGSFWSKKGRKIRILVVNENEARKIFCLQHYIAVVA